VFDVHFLFGRYFLEVEMRSYEFAKGSPQGEALAKNKKGISIL
jgi:hypothetical protein